MKNVTFILIAALLWLSACNNGAQTDEENTSSTMEAQEKVEQIAEALEQPELATEIVGVWNYGHEPDTQVFNADGTYEAGTPQENGAIEPYRKGKWTVAGNKLTITLSDGQVEANEASIVNGYLYIGTLPTQEDLDAQDYSNMHDYIAEYGYKKQ